MTPNRRRIAMLLLASGCAMAQAHAQAPLAGQACLGCHSPAATSLPPLAGRAASDIVAAMAEFRANARPATIMGRIARGFTEAEIAALAAAFAARPAP